MDLDKPQLDYDRLVRAAEAMIASYGKDALEVALGRATTMRLAGCDSSAATWDSICKIIRARLGVETLIGAVTAFGRPEPELSRRISARFSFFETP